MSDSTPNDLLYTEDHEWARVEGDGNLITVGITQFAVGQLGDVTQVDLPREQASGLIQVQEILASVDGIEFVQFGHEDVVRHKLVQRIVEAYKRHAEESGTARRR